MTTRPLKPARLAVVEGMKRGLTCKETAFEYNHSIRAVQEAARRMKLAFVWTGYGRQPVHPHLIRK
jgi:hypothetical protein